MTREEELINLLDNESSTMDCKDELLLEQQKTIEREFGEFHHLPCVITRAYRAPQVNCYDFTIEDEESFKYYKDCQLIMAAALNVLQISDKVRILQLEKGKKECRVEVPNGKCAVVAAGEAFGSTAWRNSQAALPLMLGKGCDGEIKILDLEEAPHLLVVGSPGTGKNIFMRSCLCSLILKHSPDELKLILVGSKFAEYDGFLNSPYLQFPVIHHTKDTLRTIQWLNTEIEDR